MTDVKTQIQQFQKTSNGINIHKTILKDSTFKVHSTSSREKSQKNPEEENNLPIKD